MILYILAVGRERAILEVVERLINSHEGWKAAIATGEEEAVGLFIRQLTATRPADEEFGTLGGAQPEAVTPAGPSGFSIVLVCAGFSLAEEERLRQRLLLLDPAVVVTRHYGGGSGLLENEILTILQRR